MNNMTQVSATLADLRDGQTGIIIDIDTLPTRTRMRRRKGQNEIINDFDTTRRKLGEASGKTVGKKLLCTQRLMDLGLTPGSKVVVVKSAPFNGPVEILVRGSRIALGREVASRITVEVIG